ncbi:MAG: hypothetical protein KGO92_10865 [Bacteroidota bacterium]|nr:hypothetical protein [Bacteroidota bacterium]
MKLKRPPSPISRTSQVLTQYRHENATWKRILGYLIEENIILKTRLSEILQNSTIGDNGFLDKIEYFQNQFLKEDEIFGYLKLDILEQEQLLDPDYPEESDTLALIKRNQKKLTKELETAEKVFNTLKFEFNTYLSETL